MKCRLALVLALAFVCPEATVAQTPDSPAPTATPTSAPNGDRAVVGGVVGYAVSMVKLCAVAKERASSNDTRAMCRTVSSDSARLALAGLSVEERLGETSAAPQPLPGTSDEIESLERRSGREFDRELLLAQINAGEAQIRTLQYAVEFSVDAAARAFERTALLHVRRHLDLTESTLRRISETFP